MYVDIYLYIVMYISIYKKLFKKYLIYIRLLEFPRISKGKHFYALNFKVLWLPSLMPALHTIKRFKMCSSFAILKKLSVDRIVILVLLFSGTGIYLFIIGTFPVSYIFF